jgi:hypothetical protein
MRFLTVEDVQDFLSGQVSYVEARYPCDWRRQADALKASIKMVADYLEETSDDDSGN